MKKNLTPLVCFIAITFFVNNVHAQNFSLVKDINTSKDGQPTHTINDLYIGWQNGLFFGYSAYTSAFTVFKGIVYFAASDGIHGTELWRSDNTASGTYMVKDIATGSTSSEIQNITVAGNKLFFTASRIVYVSDGTEAGTIPVPGIIYDGDQTTCLTPVGNMLYFLTKVSRVWKTDGTAAGTSLVRDFREFYAGAKDFLGQLTNVSGTLFFTVGSNNESGPELWKSDGTGAGTMMVKDIYPGATGSMPIRLTALNGKLYFSADEGSGRKLWVSDGTPTGTKAVKNTAGILLPPQTSNDIQDITPFATMNKSLYFKAAANARYELYKYDVTTPTTGITLVKDIVAGTTGSEPANLTAVDSTLYFSVSLSGSQQLYKSDGTAAGTKLLKNMGAGLPAYFSAFANNNGQLLFSYFTPENGYELWVSNGTASGTKMIKDIYAGMHSSTPAAITGLKNGIALFSATDSARGTELWSTNGTKAGTILTKNINNTTTSSSNPLLNPGTTAYINNKFFFSAWNPGYGNALYITDGTGGGTKLVDLNNGNSSNPSRFTVFENNVYFAANGGGFNRVYKSDGTVGGTVPVFNPGNSNGIVMGIYPAKDYLYVFYRYSGDSAQLWVSDGTTAGSKIIQDLTIPSFAYGGTVDNTLYFTGFDAAHGSELWKATNIPGSAVMVKNIFPGAQGSSPMDFITYKSKLYFTALDSTYNRFVYVSNGTASGTKRLFNTPIYWSNFAIAANKLFFSAFDPVAGNELFVSNGTTAGTQLVKDINPGIYSSDPGYLTVLNNNVFFSASNGTNGGELWKSDGTAVGTVMVKDIVTGSNGSFPSGFTVAGGKLYFRAQDDLYQQRLYVSGGNNANTTQVTDAGLDGVTLNTFTGGGDKLYINGYTYALGNELYAGGVPALDAGINNALVKTIDKNTQLTAAVLGNPISNNLSLSVNSNKSQNARFILTDASGKTLINKKEPLSMGANKISYPANTLVAGVYTLNIIAEDGSSTEIKIVK